MNFDDHTAAENTALLKIDEIMEQQLCHDELTELSEKEVSMVVAFAFGVFCVANATQAIDSDSLQSVFESHLKHILNMSLEQANKRILLILNETGDDRVGVLQGFAVAGRTVANILDADPASYNKSCLCEMILVQRQVSELEGEAKCI